MQIVKLYGISTIQFIWSDVSSKIESEVMYTVLLDSPQNVIYLIYSYVTKVTFETYWLCLRMYCNDGSLYKLSKKI